MSYDIRLLDPETKEQIYFGTPHQLKGGTYALGGTTEAWLNVTYNYSSHFYRVLGEKGIRSIYGLTGAASIPILEAAAAKLADDFDHDYWKPTEGNAKLAIFNLVELARAAPHGVWDGD
jgi:hypothetical protein